MDLRIFAKPKTLKNRRMGVALRAAKSRRCGRARQGRSCSRPNPLRGLKRNYAREVADRSCSRALALRHATRAAAAAEPDPVKVRGPEQDRFRSWSPDLAIALKRAIYDAGYTASESTDAGFVGEWKNLDMWMAHCVYDTGAAATGRSSPGPTGAHRFATARTFRAAACPTARSRSGRMVRCRIRAAK